MFWCMTMSMFEGSKPRPFRMSTTSFFWAFLWLISNQYFPSRLRFRVSLMTSLSNLGIGLLPSSLIALSRKRLTLDVSWPHLMRSLSFFDLSV